MDRSHLKGILYASKAVTSCGAEDLRTIREVARDNNARDGITGQLHYEQDLFLQWMEGPQESVDALWGRLQKDSRHYHVTELFSGRINLRVFDDWDMRSATASDSRLSTYLNSRDVYLEYRGPKNASRILQFLIAVVKTDFQSLPAGKMVTENRHALMGDPVFKSSRDMPEAIAAE